ncbi:MAG: hypothetical protein ACRCYZ_06350 [Alphaproteobacteria bacterium]
MKLKILTSMGLSCLFFGSFVGKAAIKREDLWGGMAYLENKGTPNAKHFARTLAAGVMAGDVMIPNLRFYGLLKPSYDKNGKRRYVNDKPLNAFGELVQILFPSPTGMLNTLTSGDRNFGRHATPQTVAKLFKFTNAVRNGGELLKLDKTKINPWKIEIIETFGLEISAKSAKRLARDLLNSIQESIHLEGELFPSGLTEILITAFLQQRFNDLEDLQALLCSLGFVSEELLQPLTKDGLGGAIFSKEPLTVSDLFAHHYKDAFNQNFPYTNAEYPIGNAPSHPYNREKNLTEAITFPDCAEATLRHLFNFFLFNPKTQTFDLSRLPADVQSTPYYENLKNFYDASQPIHFANNGSQNLRDAWNTVVGDLGEKVVYCQKHYEIDCYWDNLIRVFEKLLNLGLGVPQEGLDNAKSWLEDAFEKIFKTLNPHATSKISFDNIKQKPEGLTGSLNVTVLNEAAEEQFRFEASATGGHTEIETLVLPQKKSAICASFDKEKFLDQEDLFSALLAPSRAKGENTFFYALMEKNLSQGNTERLAWLENLQKLETQESFQDFLKNFARNVMLAISWDDVLRRFNEEEMVLYALNSIFSNTSAHEFFRPLLKEALIKDFKNNHNFLDNPLYYVIIRFFPSIADSNKTFLGGKYPFPMDDPFVLEIIENALQSLQRSLETGINGDYACVGYRAVKSVEKLCEAGVIIPENIQDAFVACVPYLRWNGNYKNLAWEKIMNYPKISGGMNDLIKEAPQKTREYIMGLVSKHAYVDNPE